jgi:hypothetical protein
MKIRLTSSQYRNLIKEGVWRGNNNNSGLVDTLMGEEGSENIIGFFQNLLGLYHIDAEDLKRDEKLYKLVFDKIKSLKDEFYHTKRVIGKLNITPLFDYIIENEVDKIMRITNPQTQFTDLQKLLNYFDFNSNFSDNSIEYKKADNLSQGLVDDAIHYILKNNDKGEIIRKLSILGDLMPYDKHELVLPIATEIAKIFGITIFSKHKGYTFTKKDDSMVRDVVNYINDIPEQPKKTKRGFLNYISSPYGAAQHSTFWSAINRAGIIEKVGGGNNVTYKLGDNYEEWENGNLVAF